jgi:hypothetical protein
LICPFLAELWRLDRRAGASSSGIWMDPDFREPLTMDLDGDGIGEVVRRELPAVLVPCQVEPETFEQLRMTPSGRAPRTSLDLVMHFRDLERLGLVRSDGNAAIDTGDRLSAILTTSGEIALTARQGLFVTEARPGGFGLGRQRARRNLLFVTFSDRALGAA